MATNFKSVIQLIEKITGEKTTVARMFLIKLICAAEKYLVCDLQITQAIVQQNAAKKAAKMPIIELS